MLFNTKFNWKTPALVASILAVTGLFLGWAINTMQMSACAVPSDKYINADACRQLTSNMLLPEVIGTALLMAIFGFITTVVATFIYARFKEIGNFRNQFLYADPEVPEEIKAQTASVEQVSTANVPNRYTTDDLLPGKNGHTASCGCHLCKKS